jgi:hypothetical protein
MTRGAERIERVVARIFIQPFVGADVLLKAAQTSRPIASSYPVLLLVQNAAG